MQRRSLFIVLAGVLITLLVGALLLLSGHSEPRYGGRTVSEWAVLLSYSMPQQSEEARTAIKALGESAVPTLIRMLEKEDSDLDVFLRKRFANVPLTFWFDTSASSSHAAAATALRELGPLARTAVPALEKRAQGPDRRMQHKANAALMAIRGENTEGLAKILTNRDRANWSNWFVAIGVTSELGAGARPLVPLLVESLNDTNSRIRHRAIMALGSIALEPELTVPAAITALTDSDQYVRQSALFVLFLFPGAAARAQTEVQQCFADP